jgi:hypothetical protein
MNGNLEEVLLDLTRVYILFITGAGAAEFMTSVEICGLVCGGR